MPLGDNALVNPSLVGVQGLNNLGVGRVSPTSGIGGFVFSAASNSVSVLIRALKIQGRLTVFSRPQIMTLDKQAAYVNVGTSIPIINGFSTNSVGNNTPTFTYQQTGVTLQVTPTITPDGRVLDARHPRMSHRWANRSRSAAASSAPRLTRSIWKRPWPPMTARPFSWAALFPRRTTRTKTRFRTSATCR